MGNPEWAVRALEQQGYRNEQQARAHAEQARERLAREQREAEEQRRGEEARQLPSKGPGLRTTAHVAAAADVEQRAPQWTSDRRAWGGVSRPPPPLPPAPPLPAESGHAHRTRLPEPAAFHAGGSHGVVADVAQGGATRADASSVVAAQAPVARAVEQAPAPVARFFTDLGATDVVVHHRRPT